MMQNQGKRRIKCSIASGLNTDFDKGNQEIEITSLRNCYLRVSMGLTDRRKMAKNLVDSRKN